MARACYLKHGGATHGATRATRTRRLVLNNPLTTTSTTLVVPRLGARWVARPERDPPSQPPHPPAQARPSTACLWCRGARSCSARMPGSASATRATTTYTTVCKQRAFHRGAQRPEIISTCMLHAWAVQGYHVVENGVGKAVCFDFYERPVRQIVFPASRRTRSDIPRRVIVNRCTRVLCSSMQKHLDSPQTAQKSGVTTLHCSVGMDIARDGTRAVPYFYAALREYWNDCDRT